MKLRFLSAVGAVILIPALLAGCDDDPTGPVDEIYSLTSVVVEGDTVTAPAVLYDGLVDLNDGSTTEIDYQLRRGTLLLFENGRYEFSGYYQYRFPQLNSEPFTVGAFEDGTYTRTATNITFTPAAGSERLLGSTATLRNGGLAVAADDPLFTNFSYTLMFDR